MGAYRFHGVFRQGSNSTTGISSASYIGYGGGISGDVKPGWFGWTKDDITFQATAGNGIGRY